MKFLVLFGCLNTLQRRTTVGVSEINVYYALIRSSTEHKLFMYLTSSIILKRHKHQIYWDQLARSAANNLLIKYKYSPYKHHT